jgi:hypothetical protein
MLHRLKHLVVQTRSDAHNLYKFSVISCNLCNYAAYLYHIHPLVIQRMSKLSSNQYQICNLLANGNLTALYYKLSN